MKELKITDEKVREASKSCPTAKAVLEALFPEAFKNKEFKVGDIVKAIKRVDGNDRTEGKYAIVRYVKGSCIGLEFFESVGGHALEGSILKDEKINRGYNSFNPQDELILITRADVNDQGDC